MTHKKKKKLLLSTLGIVITCIVIALFLVGIEPLTQLITPQEETFTELYFEDHLKLPKVLYRGIPTTVSFTIHNLEGKDMQYPVKIIVLDDSEPPQITMMSDTSVSISKNASKTIPVDIGLPVEAPDRQKVVIELVNLDQSIHFWAQVATPSSKIINEYVQQ